MAMIDVFLKSVGFDPAEFAQACEHYKREFEGMKGGLQHAVQHFNTQLETVKANQAAMSEHVLRIERKIDALIADIRATLPLTTQETKPNGHHHIERTDDDGSWPRNG